MEIQNNVENCSFLNIILLCLWVSESTNCPSLLVINYDYFFSIKGSDARVQIADFDAHGLADIFCGKDDGVTVLMNPGKHVVFFSF